MTLYQITRGGANVFPQCIAIQSNISRYQSNISRCVVYFSSRRELTRRDFSRRFSVEAAWKVKMLWRQTSPVTPCFGQKIVMTRDQQKHDIEIPQNRQVWSGSLLMIVQNGWIFSICEIYWEYGTAGHLVFWKPWPAVKLKKVPSVTKHGFVFWAQRKLNTRLL